MNAPVKTLAECAAAGLKQRNARMERELRELANYEPPPPTFGPAVARARPKPKTTPMTTAEICRDVIDRLLETGRCRIEGNVMIYRGGSLRQNVPLRAPGQIVTACRLHLRQDCTIDLANEILKFIGENYAK